MYRKEEIDLSLKQPLCDLIATYWQAFHARLDHDEKFEEDFHVLEDYLCNVGAILHPSEVMLDWWFALIVINHTSHQNMM